KSFSVMPFSSKTYTFEVECKYRGYYSIGVERVEITDLLGLINIKYTVREPIYITVYPKIVELERFHIKTNYISESHALLDTKFEDMATISNIRKYAYGDRIKKIHWKLTAKKNELMVKEFQNTTETSLMIVLDLSRNT